MNATKDAELLLVLRNYSLRGKKIPESMFGGIIQYVVYRNEPGGFLKALICNDLINAVKRADDTNIDLLDVYVGFFYNEAPSGCWGSADKYIRWVCASKS